MKKLLSLPPNLVHCFHELEEVDASEWFCTSDPVGAKLGSGGGTTWLLQACHENYASKESFSNWLELKNEFYYMPEGRAGDFRDMPLPGKFLRRSLFSVGSVDRS